jgi:hypothetical protein
MTEAEASGPNPPSSPPVSAPNASYSFFADCQWGRAEVHGGERAARVLSYQSATELAKGLPLISLGCVRNANKIRVTGTITV